MRLIVGSTGSLGGRVAHTLLSQGDRVRALVRPGSAHEGLEKAGVELCFGDLKDRGSLERACRGVETVVATATAATRGGADTVEAVDRKGYQALVEVAEVEGVEQFVFVSAHGFESDSPLPLARAKAATEHSLRRADLAATILRPGLFMEPWIGWVVGAQLTRGDLVSVIGDPDHLYPFVATADVAALAAEVTGDQSAYGESLPLAGGMASYRQIVHWVREATGRPIELRSLPSGERLAGFPPLVAELWALEIHAIETGPVAERFGLAPIVPRDFVLTHFAAASG